MSSFPQSQSTQPISQGYSFQGSSAQYPSQTHYPTANYVPAATFGTAAYPGYQTHLKQELSPGNIPLPQNSSGIDSEIASKSLHRLISVEMKNEGFDAAEPLALQMLEAELVNFVEKLHQRAHEYANLANRTVPLAVDLLEACDECGLELEDLQLVAQLSKLRKKDAVNAVSAKPLTLVLAPPRAPPPKLLDSDDEDGSTAVPTTLRTIPHYYPSLPPKHTYLRTPPSPPKKQALPSLEKRLKNAGLVQESLKNLLLATEDTVGPDDGELLGAIVNWEATSHPRKRWRVQSH